MQLLHKPLELARWVGEVESNSSCPFKLNSWLHQENRSGIKQRGMAMYDITHQHIKAQSKDHGTRRSGGPGRGTRRTGRAGGPGRRTTPGRPEKLCCFLIPNDRKNYIYIYMYIYKHTIKMQLIHIYQHTDTYVYIADAYAQISLRRSRIQLDLCRKFFCK